MTPAPKRFDVACRVIDNFGDAGVALRLARQLAREHRAEVTLWIDRLASLARIAEGLDPLAVDQRQQGVRVRLLDAHAALEPMPEVLVEAFGCGLPDSWLEAMSAAPRPPVWINLEYLSAEAWIDGTHGLPSPQPRRPLTRWFYFPGFTRASGGLLREHDLFARRDALQCAPDARLDPWRTLGLAPPAADTLTVSLYAYANEALPALLDAWTEGDAAIACLVPEGTLGEALARWSGTADLARGQGHTRGALSIAVSPFVDQAAFDRRLWACDLNLVRGEDSFLRAQWAARPFAWQAYAQADAAHRAKLDAFLDRYCSGLEAGAAQAMRDFCRACNGETPAAVAGAWQRFRCALPALRAHTRRWAEELAEAPDLTSQLVDFAVKRL